MTSNPLPLENGDFSEDLIGVNEYIPQTPKRKDFLPWHKPRKQFVRNFQWTQQILKLIEEVGLESDVLKYLGLPGDDLLDLRYFHHLICVQKNLKLRFLGFNRAANPNDDSGTDLNISLDEINKLQFVDPASDIIGDDICQIANRDSVAYSRSVKMGPYDVINIDLCDGFGIHPIGNFGGNHFDALSQLMALQARRPTPWLLLLTTRTGAQHIDPGVLEQLKSIYLANLEKCEIFFEKSSEEFSITDRTSLEFTTSDDGKLSDIFLISLSKWVASLAMSQSPPATLELKSVIGYKVDHKVSHQDLVSLAIKVTPTMIPQRDKSGLASQTHIPLDECKVAVQVFDRIGKQVNADGVLSANAEIMSQMISETTVLLEEARYEISEYESWARSQ